jgi:hypothetical protein
MASVRVFARRCGCAAVPIPRAVVGVLARMPVTGLLAVAALAWLAALMAGDTQPAAQPIAQPRPVAMATAMSTALTASPLGGDDGGDGGCGGGLACGGGVWRRQR